MTSTYSIILKLDTSEPNDRRSYTPEDLFEPLPAHTHVGRTEPQEGWSVQDKKNKRKFPERRIIKDWRFGPLRVEWVDFAGMDDKKEIKPLQQYVARSTFTLTTAPSTTGTTHLPSGSIHLYRHPSLRPLATDDPSTGTLLAILALPTYVTPSDLLAYVAPCTASDSISHVRILHDQAPDRSVVLLKFRNKKSAQEFASHYDGKTFNSMAPEVCHVVEIDSVTISPLPSSGDLSSTEESQPSSSSTVAIPQNALELPTCPVCLDRMDSALTGLITVPCTHTFHCSCLSRWVDSRCPVCRASAAPPAPSRGSSRALTSRTQLPAESQRRGRDDRPSHCADCTTTTSLWICLICGNLGCGRYARAHAAAHFESTHHTYALELETQRVWDYAGDTYVHRLIRNRADGKVVELPSASTNTGSSGGTSGNMGPGPEQTEAAEKMEAMGVEYGMLLTTQLETQREWYEEKIGEVESRLREALDAATAPRGKSVEELEEEQKKMAALEQRQKEEHASRERAERKAQQATELARRLQSELAAERAQSSGLLENLAAARAREESFTKEREEWKEKMKDMEEQLRDLMVFLEAREKIESGQIGVDGIAGGTVELPPVPTTPKSPGKKKRTGKR